MSTVRSRSSDVALLRSDRFATFCRCERFQIASFRSIFLLLVFISVQRSTTFSMTAELPVASANEYQTNVNVDASASTELQTTTTTTTTSLLPTHHSSSWSTEGGSRLPPAYRKQLPKNVLDGKSNYNLENVSQSSPDADFVHNSLMILSNEVVDGASHTTTTAAMEVAPAAGVMSGRTRKLPEAIIIGVKKGGTRALLEFLKIHPDIRAPGPEIHYFDRFYDKGLEWYRSRMPPTLPGQLTVEKTPSYFVTRSAPQRVYRSMPRDIRLIVVVRDPVTRALSDYTQGLVKRPDLLPFERMAFSAPSTLPGGVNASSTSPLSSSTPARVTSQSVNISWGAIRIGLYARHLNRWLRWFPLDRFHFVSGERLVEDPAGEIGRLEDFLGVQRVVTSDHFYFNVTKGFPCLKKSEARAVPRCLGQAKGRAHPVVDPVAIERLRRFFRPYNRKFYEMTGIDFGWQ